MTKEKQEDSNAKRALDSEVKESKQERSFIDYVATRIKFVKEMLETEKQRLETENRMLETEKQRGKTELSEFEEICNTIETRMEEAGEYYEPNFGRDSLAEESIKAEGTKNSLVNEV